MNDSMKSLSLAEDQVTGMQLPSDASTRIELIVRNELQIHNWRLANPKVLALRIAAVLSDQNQQRLQTYWNIDQQVRRVLMSEYSQVLYSALVGNDKDREERAYLELWQFIYRRVLAQVERADDAEDISQATLMQVYNAVSKLSDGRGLFGWLSVLMVRAIRMYHYQQTEISYDLQEELDDELSEPKKGPSEMNDNFLYYESGFDSVASEDTIRAAIESLPRVDQEILVASFLQDRSTSEIAEILQIPVQQVYLRRYRALQRLRETLLRSTELAS